MDRQRHVNCKVASIVCEQWASSWYFQERAAPAHVERCMHMGGPLHSARCMLRLAYRAGETVPAEALLLILADVNGCVQVHEFSSFEVHPTSEPMCAPGSTRRCNAPPSTHTLRGLST